MSERDPMLNTCSIVAAKDAYAAGNLGEADTLCIGILNDTPNDVATLRLLSRLSLDRGDALEAVRILAQALAVDPSRLDIRCEIAAACQKADRVAEAIEHLELVIATTPQFFRAYGQLANLYYEAGRIEDAARVYGQWHVLDPTQVEVGHMATATSGLDVPVQCSPEFVKIHFNGLATTFNKRLVGDLGYVGHQVACEALTETCDVAINNFAILDAGCGTGLCGPLIKRHRNVLTGVDLAEKMIAQAARTGAYDSLIVEDICVHMRAHRGAYDAIISSDVLIYIGDLTAVFESANGALTNGGLFVATLERSVEEGPASYRLEPHGRYTHSENYVRSIVRETGFEIVHLAETQLRRELGRNVAGLLVVSRKAA